LRDKKYFLDFEKCFLSFEKTFLDFEKYFLSFEKTFLDFEKCFLRAKILVGVVETKVFKTLKMIALTETMVGVVGTRVVMVETRVDALETMVAAVGTRVVMIETRVIMVEMMVANTKKDITFAKNLPILWQKQFKTWVMPILWHSLKIFRKKFSITKPISTFPTPLLRIYRLITKKLKPVKMILTRATILK
jgi:hypothetical protein